MCNCLTHLRTNYTVGVLNSPTLLTVMVLYLDQIHSIYKTCYHGKIWGLSVLCAQHLHISASEAALRSLSHKPTRFAENVALGTQLCNAKVSFMEGFNYTAWQDWYILPTYAAFIPIMCSMYCCSGLCHRLKLQSAAATPAVSLLYRAITLILSVTPAVPTGQLVALRCIAAWAPVTDRFWPKIK